MANAVANIQHHRICLGLRLQESQQALIAGLQHYHVLNQAIATLQRKLEVYETQNINLESMISKLKYLSNSHPQDVPAGFKQILQEADQLNITDLVRPVPFILTQQSRTAPNSTRIPARTPLPITVNGCSPSTDSNMGSESLADNLKRTNQLMREAETKKATMATPNALPKLNPGCVSFTPACMRQAPPVRKLNARSDIFIPSINKLELSTSTEALSPQKGVPVIENELSDQSESSEKSPEAPTPHKRTPVMVKKPSIEAHSSPSQIQVAEQPKTAEPFQAQFPTTRKLAPVMPLQAQIPAAENSTPAAPMPGLAAPVPKLAKVLPHLCVPPHLRVPTPAKAQAVAQSTAAIPVQAQNSASGKPISVTGADAQVFAAEAPNPKTPSITVKAPPIEPKTPTKAMQAQFTTTDKPTQVTTLEAQVPAARKPTPTTKVTLMQAEFPATEESRPLMPVPAQVLAAEKPALEETATSAQAQFKKSTSMTPVQAPAAPAPANKEAEVLPHLRVPAHVRALRASTSTQNIVLPVKTNRVSTTTAMAENGSNKENVKFGDSPVKTDPATKYWLDTLERKGALSRKASSNSFADKLIDDFDDDDIALGKLQRVPTPPGFTPITKRAPAAEAKNGYAVPKNEKNMGSTFMAKALSALPTFTQKYRSTSELGSPTEEEYIAPEVNGTRVLGSLLDEVSKKHVIMPNSRGQFYQPSMEWYPVVRAGKRCYVL